MPERLMWRSWMRLSGFINPTSITLTAKCKESDARTEVTRRPRELAELDSREDHMRHPMPSNVSACELLLQLSLPTISH